MVNVLATYCDICGEALYKDDFGDKWVGVDMHAACTRHKGVKEWYQEALNKMVGVDAADSRYLGADKPKTGVDVASLGADKTVASLVSKDQDIMTLDGQVDSKVREHIKETEDRIARELSMPHWMLDDKWKLEAQEQSMNEVDTKIFLAMALSKEWTKKKE